MKKSQEKWRKAQVSEKVFWDRNCSIVQEATKDVWTQKVQKYLLDGFSIDFEFFNGKKLLEIGGGPIGMVRYIAKAVLKVNIDPLNMRFFGGLYAGI
jgi:ubiquinone/menaquinone biosynthesis C-methylase UbiE